MIAFETFPPQIAESSKSSFLIFHHIKPPNHLGGRDFFGSTCELSIGRVANHPSQVVNIEDFAEEKVASRPRTVDRVVNPWFGVGSHKCQNATGHVVGSIFCWKNKRPLKLLENLGATDEPWLIRIYLGDLYYPIYVGIIS